MIASRFFVLLEAIFFGVATFAAASSSLDDLPPAFHRLARRVEARELMRQDSLSTRNAKMHRRSQSGKLLPLKNGFPNPSPQEAANIQIDALGTLPNGPLPNKLTEGEKTSLQLVALNELFEVSDILSSPSQYVCLPSLVSQVAFFSSLLYNVTNNVPGFTDLKGESRDYVLKTLVTVLAQEEIHALGANAILKNSGFKPIEPCSSYNFPTTDFASAIGLADLFTGVVLGALQEVVEVFAAGGAAPATRLIASVIGQEGAQKGWFRSVAKHVPSETPFLTTATGAFAFTVIQNFFSGCPSLGEIKLRTYAAVKVAQAPSNKYTPGRNTSVIFQVPPKRDDKPAREYYATYINQQNLPITVPLKVHASLPHTPDHWLTLEGPFPYSDKLLNGLTIAAIGCIPGPFKDIHDVANSVYWAPGLIYLSPPDK